MRGLFKAFLAGTALVVSGTAAAQTSGVPNYGDYESLDGLFRIGIQSTDVVSGVRQQAAFEQNEIDGIIDYLDPAELRSRIGALNTQIGAVTGVFDIRGATAIAGYAQNSPDLTVRIVAPDGSTIRNNDGQLCSFTYSGQTANGASRQAAFDQLDAETDDPSLARGKALIGCLGRAFTRYSPVDPLVGNPGSLQASMVRSSLDLTNGDSLIEAGDGANSSGDPWIVGASYGGGSARRFDISRVDARIARGFRVFEGNRALLKLDLPFNYTRINGASAYTGQIGLGLELPLIARRWSLEPRVGYGIVYSADAGSVGHIAQATLASRYLIEGVGRGRIIIGNLVGYGATLGTPSDYDLNPDVRNWSFRNGVAYEMPLKFRAGGRLALLRASYTFTAFAGDTLYSNTFHEATLSFGPRGREETPRAGRDLIRFNFTTVQAKGYSTYTGGVGFRF